jgi:hypothetical protein
MRDVKEEFEYLENDYAPINERSRVSRSRIG